jgi:hypothetical protein
VYVSGTVLGKFFSTISTNLGPRTFSSKEFNKPCYWVDGVRNDLSTPEGFLPSHRTWDGIDSFYVTLAGIGILNKNVYVGVTSMSAARSSDRYTRSGYWVNNTFTQFIVYTRAIAIADGIAYIAFNRDNPTREGGYTVFGQSILLGANTRVNDIAVEGGEVLITGSYRDGSKFRDGTEIDKPCLWIDGNRVPLPLHQNYTGGYADAIAVEGVDTVILGQYTDGSKDNNGRLIYKGCYWVDTEFKQIPDSERYDSIALLDGITYIAGAFNRGGIWMACYWVNGERNIIPYGRSAGKIIVTKK